MSSHGAEPTPKVLIGAAGTTTAFGIVRTLRSNWPDGVRIFVADLNPRRLVAAAALADRYLQSPPIAEQGYGEWLAAALADTGADLYVPLIDEDIAVAAGLAARGATSAARIAAPPLESARVCWDKLASFEWLRGEGIPTCDTWLPAETPRDGRPLIVKSRRGQGSTGFRRLGDAAELDSLAAGEDLVVQTRCDPPEVTVDAFLSRDATAFRAICRERLETKAGISTKARVFESTELAALVERVVRGLGLTGASCVQAMRGGSEWQVTDVNARPGAGARLSTAAGVDLLGAAYADLLGLPFDSGAALRELDRDAYVVRQFDEYVVE